MIKRVPCQRGPRKPDGRAHGFGVGRKSKTDESKTQDEVRVMESVRTTNTAGERVAKTRAAVAARVNGAERRNQNTYEGGISNGIIET